MVQRRCRQCNKNMEKNNFYSQRKKKKNGEEYIYYHPECKECTKNRSLKWTKNNPNKRKNNVNRYNTSPERRKVMREVARERVKSGYMLDWQRNNKDKIKEYNYRRQNKQHDITEQEWKSCKEYFDYKCAYCNMSEREHRQNYNQQLHRDHFEHEGLDDLSNCIPACKPCNTSKHTFEAYKWYKDSEHFNEINWSKINKWLNSDYKLFIKE